MDQTELLGGLHLLLVGTTLLGKIGRGQQQPESLLPLGDRVAAGLMALPIIVALCHNVFPSAPPEVKLLSAAPLALYVCLLVYEDRRSYFTLVMFFGVTVIYLVLARIILVKGLL